MLPLNVLTPSYSIVKIAKEDFEQKSFLLIIGNLKLYYWQYGMKYYSSEEYSFRNCNRMT